MTAPATTAEVPAGPPVPAAEPLRFCAVIPVHDNESTVADVIRSAARFVERVVVVDDGSRDGTPVAANVAAAVSTAAGRPVECVTLRENRGKGAALVAGFRRAAELGFTHAVTIDADGQHQASDIPALLGAAEEHPASIVVGARDMGSDRIAGAARLGRSVSNFWTERTTGFRLPDTTCGLRVYPLREVVALPIETVRYDYEGEVLIRGAWAGLALVGVPIDVWYPVDRSARVSSYRPWVDSIRVGAMYLRLAFQRLLPARGTGGEVRRAPGAPISRLLDTLRRLRGQFVRRTGTSALSLAVGIGVFLGATPLWGLHAPMAGWIATRWRLNLGVTLLATCVSFPLFAPVLVLVELQTGHWLLGGEGILLGLAAITPAAVLQHLAEYVVGAFALAPLLGLAAGLATFALGSLASGLRSRGRSPAPSPQELACPIGEGDVSPAPASSR